MPNELTIDQLFNAKPVFVELPGFIDAGLYCKACPAADAGLIREAAKDIDEKRAGDDDESTAAASNLFAAKLMVICACDSHGNLLFDRNNLDEEARRVLDRVTIASLDAFARVAIRINTPQGDELGKD